VLGTENRPTCCRFVLIRQSCLSCKNKPNSSYSCKFIRNTTKNCINPLEIPLRYNVGRSRVWISGDIIIWVSLRFWVEGNLKGCKLSLGQGCSKVFGIEVGIKINHIGVCSNSLWISRSILVLCCKVNLASGSLLERKLVMETIETIQCRIIYSESSPKPSNNTSTNNRQSTSLTSNNSCTPQRHLHT